MMIVVVAQLLEAAWAAGAALPLAQPCTPRLLTAARSCWLRPGSGRVGELQIALLEGFGGGAPAKKK